MAWQPLPPVPPAAGWWTELSLDRWVAGVAAGMAATERAERAERLRALAHKVDMRCAGALAADRWERIQRRRGGMVHDHRMVDDRGFVREHGGFQVDSWGAGHGEIEHHPGGRVLGVR
jgi:hypothetical protein